MFFTPLMSLPDSKNISNVLTSITCLTLRISHKTFSSITFHHKRKFFYLTNTAVCYPTIRTPSSHTALLPLTTSVKVTRVLWVQRPDTIPTKIIYRPPPIKDISHKQQILLLWSSQGLQPHQEICQPKQNPLQLQGSLMHNPAVCCMCRNGFKDQCHKAGPSGSLLKNHEIFIPQCQLTPKLI
jgi:hypothetical protein